MFVHFAKKSKNFSIMPFMDEQMLYTDHASNSIHFSKSMVFVDDIKKL